MICDRERVVDVIGDRRFVIESVWWMCNWWAIRDIRRVECVCVMKVMVLKRTDFKM